MTQPRKPSGPGEWRKGDWVYHRRFGAAQLTLEDGLPVGPWVWLARPVENDPEGWCEARGRNPIPGVSIAIEARRDGRTWASHSDAFNWDLWVDWRPSTEPTSSPAPEAEPVSKSPENEQVGGLIERLRSWPQWSNSKSLKYGGTEATMKAAATALEAAHRRIAELEGEVDETSDIAFTTDPENGQSVAWSELHASLSAVANARLSRALKAEASLAEAEKVADRIRSQVKCSAANLKKGGADPHLTDICLAHFTDLADELSRAFLQQGET